MKLSILKRANRNNWLESHIWHAKRFKMEKLFNYTIAVNRLDKGFKACYRYSKYDSCIYDSSYYNYLFIDPINPENVIPIFQKIIQTSSLNNFSKLQKFHKYKINLYDIDNKRLIGPCSILLLENSIIIIFHPLMRKEMIKLFRNFVEDDVKIYYNNIMNNFTLIGPRITENIFKILKSLTPDSDNNLMNKFKNQIDFSNYLNLINDNEVLLIETFLPESQFKMNELMFRELTKEIIGNIEKESSIDYIKTNEEMSSIAYNNNFHLYDNIKTNFLQHSYPLNNINTSESDEKKNYIEIPTERTVFMHRKNVKLNVLNKKLETSIRDYKKKDKIKKVKLQSKKMDSNNKMQVVELLPQSKLASTDKKIYLILLKNTIEVIDKDNKRIVTPVYNFIFPKGSSLDLLRRFVYLETRPIGLREYNYFLTNTNSFIFPDDYPSTNSYQYYIKDKTINMIDKYCRYPASKRVNFQKIGNPYPFYAAWHRLNKKNFETTNTLTTKFHSFNKDVEIVSDLSNKEKLQRQFIFQNIITPITKIFLIPVHVEMIGKGIPCYNSLICLPNIDDLEKLNIRYSKEGSLKGKNLMNKIFDKIKDNKEILLRLDNSGLGDETDKISEGVLRTEIKNKHFNVEYETIKKEILTKNDDDNEVKYSSDILNDDLTIKLPCDKDISRRVIGFITSGQFSYISSKGIAKGFIHVQSYEALIKIKNDEIEKDINKNHNKNDSHNVFALIRKNTSRNYYFAKIRLTKMN